MRKQIIPDFLADGITFGLMVLDVSFCGASQMINGLMGFGYPTGLSVSVFRLIEVG